MNQHSTPPPAHNLVVLSADLLAVAAKRIIDQLACASWEPMQQLKSALDTYEATRMGTILRDSDPQRMNCEPAPETQRSVHS